MCYDLVEDIEFEVKKLRILTANNVLNTYPYLSGKLRGVYKVCVTGISGSGKTTMIRCFDPEAHGREVPRPTPDGNLQAMMTRIGIMSWTEEVCLGTVLTDFPPRVPASSESLRTQAGSKSNLKIEVIRFSRRERPVYFGLESSLSRKGESILPGSKSTTSKQAK